MGSRAEVFRGTQLWFRQARLPSGLEVPWRLWLVARIPGGVLVPSSEHGREPQVSHVFAWLGSRGCPVLASTLPTSSTAHLERNPLCCQLLWSFGFTFGFVTGQLMSSRGEEAESEGVQDTLLPPCAGFTFHFVLMPGGEVTPQE